ncbi:hypothetical protein Tco_0425920 [Tanacetum coccineum]
MKCDPASAEGTALAKWRNLVRKLGNALERAECKKLKKELGWTEMKKLMTPEFCLAEELHRMGKTTRREVTSSKVFNLNKLCVYGTIKLCGNKSCKLRMKGFLKGIRESGRTFKVGTVVVRATTRITHANLRE